MKYLSKISIGMLIGMILLVGCAPSVSVIPAGQENQYEVTVRADEFAVENTDELLQAWHEKARETCNGNYNVLSRDIVQREEMLNEIIITGIIECQ